MKHLDQLNESSFRKRDYDSMESLAGVSDISIETPKYPEEAAKEKARETLPGQIETVLIDGSEALVEDSELNLALLKCRPDNKWILIEEA